MRIIRPLDDMAAVTTSNAPDDAIGQWQPVGRDLLSTTTKPIFDIFNGSTLYAISESGGKILKQDMATGAATAPYGYSIPSKVARMVISPDGVHVAIVAIVSGTSRLYVLKLSDGSLKALTTLSASGSVYTPIEWQADNKNILTASNNTVYEYNIDTTAVVIKYTATGGVTSFCRGGGFLYVLYKESSDKALSGGIAKLDGTTYAEERKTSVSRFYPADGVLIYNSTNSSITRITQHDPFQNNWTADFLAPLAKISAYFDHPQSVVVTATHLVVRNLSWSPYWVFLNLSDYSVDHSLTFNTFLTNRGEGIAIGTNYTVVQQNQGIALVDNTTRDLVSQQNPNVIKGDTYIYNNKVYEVLTNNNVQPDEGAAAEPPTWLALGAINRLRMFDNKIDSVTRGNSSLNITIDAKQALNGIALFNVTAATVQITMTDGTYGLVYDTGEVLMRDSSQIRGWYDWFFSSRPKMRDLARIDLPTFPNAIVEVTLTGDNVSLGEIVIGRVQKIGETQYGGTSVGIIDSSIKERDDFGNFVIAERPFSKRVEFDVHVPTSGISGVQNILASYRAKPVVYVGAEGEEALVVFGFYRDFQINYTSYSIAASTITVEGL